MHTQRLGQSKGGRPAGRWGPLEWLAAALLAIVVATVGVLFVNWRWVQHGNAPAWVQAIGSVVAILVAVAISTKQSRDAQRADSMRAAQQLDAIAAMVAAFDWKSYDALITRHPGKHGPAAGVNHLYTIDEIVDEVQAAADGIAAVKLDTIGSEIAVQALLMVRSRLRGVVELAQVMRSRELTVAEWNAFVAKREGIHIYIQQLRHQAAWVADGYPLCTRPARALEPSASNLWTN